MRSKLDPPGRGRWGRFKLWMQMTYDFPRMAKGSATYSPKPARWFHFGRGRVRRHPADFSLESRVDMQRVVATGEWLYGGSAPTPVRIVQLDYGFWYEIAAANGELEDGERPVLNDEGYRFYVRFTPGWQEGEPFWPDSPGADSIEAAKQEAETRVPTPITWL